MARDHRSAKKATLCFIIILLFRRSKFALLTLAHVLLRILLRHRGRYYYEADISGGGPDVTRGVVCSLEFVPCLFLMTSSLTIVGPAGRSYTTFHNEGKGGLYRRMLLTLLGMSNFTLQFVTYEWMRDGKLSQAAACCDARACGRRTATSWCVFVW